MDIRTKQINIILTESEKYIIIGQAIDEGLSVSSFCRTKILGYINSKKDEDADKIKKTIGFDLNLGIFKIRWN